MYQKFKEAEQLLKSQTALLNQKSCQTIYNLWKIQDFQIDQKEGKSYLYHIQNHQSKKYSAKISVSDQDKAKKMDQPKVCGIKQNFVPFQEIKKYGDVQEKDQQENQVNSQQLQFRQVKIITKPDIQMVLYYTKQINQNLRVRVLSWKVDRYWRAEQGTYKLLVFQLSSRQEKAMAVLRQRYDYLGWGRNLVFVQHGQFNPKNLPWKRDYNQTGLGRVTIPEYRYQAWVDYQKHWFRVKNAYVIVKQQKPEFYKFINKPWEKKKQVSISDPFSSNILFGLMDLSPGTLMTEYFRFLNPDQQVNYWDYVDMGDPNQNIRMNRFKPMAIKQLNENTQAVFHLQLPNLLSKQRKIQVRIGVKSLIQSFSQTQENSKAIKYKNDQEKQQIQCSKKY